MVPSLFNITTYIPDPVQEAGQNLCQASEVLGVPCPVLQPQVQVTRLLPHWVVRLAMHREGEHGGVRPKYQRSPVALQLQSPPTRKSRFSSFIFIYKVAMCFCGLVDGEKA